MLKRFLSSVVGATQWCESQKACGRLKLADLLMKPLQRLTKYKLLLYAVRSPLDKMLSDDVTVSDRIAAIDTAVCIPQLHLEDLFRINRGLLTSARVIPS